MNVIHFKTETSLRTWFRKNAATEKEVWIGFYRKELNRKGVSYASALDEALCWGWIDGVRKKIDDQSYTNRFTPRKSDSIWSRVNIEHVARLIQDGRMQPLGLAAFEARTEKRTGVYSFEQQTVEFAKTQLSQFKKMRDAWSFFETQPQGYRKLVTHWVISAKREETRQRRLEQLIDICSQKVRLRDFINSK